MQGAGGGSVHTAPRVAAMGPIGLVASMCAYAVPFKGTPVLQYRCYRAISRLSGRDINADSIRMEPCMGLLKLAVSKQVRALEQLSLQAFDPVAEAVGKLVAEPA